MTKEIAKNDRISQRNAIMMLNLSDRSKSVDSLLRKLIDRFSLTTVICDGQTYLSRSELEKFKKDYRSIIKSETRKTRRMKPFIYSINERK